MRETPRRWSSDLRTLRALGLGLVLVLPAVVCLAVPAAAQRSQQPAVDPAATYTTTIVVRDVDARGNVLATETIHGSPQPVGTRQRFTGAPRALLDSGLGGLPSPAGCRTLTVTNRTSTVTGRLAYKFITENHWCWNLAQERVYDLSVHVRIADVDPMFRYRGIVNAFNQTISGVGKRVYRQGQFDNCVPKFGCIGTRYPSNDAKLMISGMWTWTTNG